MFDPLNLSGHVFGPADKGEPGKKKQRKTTRAGGAGVDLTAIAQEQAVKNTADREVLKEKVKAIKDERAANATAAPETSAEAKAKVKVVEASQTGKDSDCKYDRDPYESYSRSYCGTKSSNSLFSI